MSSFGTQRHFSAEHKPEGAGDRCLECGVEETCPYSAKKIYLDKAERGYTGWPLKVLVDGVPDIENVTAALESGPCTCVCHAWGGGRGEQGGGGVSLSIA